MTIKLPQSLNGALFLAGPTGQTGPQGAQGPQGTQGAPGSQGAQGSAGPAPWTTPIPWAPGLNCSAAAPATAVTYNDCIYICAAPHIAGDMFDAAMWQLVLSPTGWASVFSESLTVTDVNTLSQLSYPYSGAYAVLFVNGQAYLPSSTPPPFSISGKIVTWDNVATGITFTPGQTEVAILYSTVVAPVFTQDYFLTLLTAAVQSLPINEPDQPNVLWLDGRTLCLS